jgi:WD40 repeat protein
MVAKKPDDRYQSMSEVIAALQTALGQAPAETSTPTGSSASVAPSKADESPVVTGSASASDKVAATQPMATVKEESAPAVDETVDYVSRGDTDPSTMTQPLSAARVATSGHRRPAAHRQRKHTPLRMAAAIALTLVIAAIAAAIIYVQTDYGTIAVDAEDEGIGVAIRDDSPVNYQLKFDDVTSSVQTPVTYDGSHPITLEAWAAVSANHGKCGHLISNYGDPGGICLEVKPSGHWGYAMKRGGDYQSDIAKTPAARRRQHVALVYAGDKPLLFVDGRLQQTEKEWDHIGDYTYANSEQPFVVGSVTSRGWVDEVRFSRGVRYTGDFTPQERFESDEDTLALYHFDEGYGETAHDASNNGNNARIVGARWSEVGEECPLPGLVARPTRLADGRRWQVATAFPRGNTDAVAWSPGGDFIACGTDGGDVHVYDAATLTLYRLLIGHLDRVVSISWRPDGRWIASGGAGSGEVRLWQANGTPGPVFQHGSGGVGVAWSPDGQWLASASERNVQLWTVEGSLGPTLRIPGLARRLAWSPDSKQLVAGFAGLWILNVDGTPSRELEGAATTVFAVAWSPDGERIAAAGSEGVLQMWSPDGTLLATPDEWFEEKGAILHMAWSPNGQQLAVGGAGVRVWDVGDSPKLLFERSNYPKGLAWSPDGNHIASCGSSLQTWRIDGTQGQTLETVPRGWTQLSWHPSGRRFACGTDFADGEIWIWRTDGTPEQLFQADKQVAPENGCWVSAYWSPDGKHIASKGAGKKFQIWHADGTAAAIAEGHTDRIWWGAWSPDGRRFATVSSDKTVRFWHPDGTLAAVLEGQRESTTRAWSPNSQWFATANRHKTIRLWQMDGKAGPVLEGYDVNGLTWSPDSRQLAIGNREDGTVQVWQVDDSECHVLDPPGGPEVHSVAWNPGARLASANAHGVKIWNSDGSADTMRVGGGSFWQRLKWSPDGRYLISSCGDHTIRRWTGEGTLITALDGYAGYARSIQWSPDGKQLAAVVGSARNTIKLWDFETGEPLWTTSLLPGSQNAVTFSPSGEILHGDPEVIEKELRYLIEQPDGSMEMLKPSEFQELVAAGR